MLRRVPPTKHVEEPLASARGAPLPQTFTSQKFKKGVCYDHISQIIALTLRAEKRPLKELKGSVFRRNIAAA
jgi:hypothetical protein